jgi:hypothetical protein
MKSVRIVLVVFIVSVFLVCAFIEVPSRVLAGATIKGSVSPPDGAVRAWAISANKDTASSMINDGVFVITAVRPGLYNLLIEARAPYKNAGIPEIAVTEEAVIDVGQIKLVK